MKNLLLFRHGKSDWNAHFDEDHDRPLAPRGEVASRRIGRFLASVGPLPELVITSSALRAQATLELARAAGNWPGSISVSRRLYEGDLQTLLNLIQEQEDSITSLMLVGHNPAWETFAGLLIGGGRLRFPTAALARIKFSETSWRQVDFGKGTLFWLIAPKILEHIDFPNRSTHV